MAESSQDRILYRLKSRGPQTTGTLANHLGVTRAGARKHLGHLEAEGLVAPDDRAETVGRPKRYWSLSGSGHARFPDAHSSLTLELIHSVRRVFGETGLEKLITDRERETLAVYQRSLAGCRTLGSRVRKLAKLRSEEGYMAESTRERSGVYVLAENHCPICAAATECQGLCRSELDVFREVLGPEAGVTRIDHVLAGSRRCAYRIAAREPD